MASNDYRIQKERLPVVVTTVGGERLAGDLFVQASARNRYGRENAHDIANTAEPFFPLAAADGETYLLAKDRVRDIEVSGEQEMHEDWHFGAPATVEVWVTGGAKHTGVVYLESVSGRSRVLDYLNRVGERFLTLQTARGAVLVNRSFIELVRPLD